MFALSVASLLPSWLWPESRPRQWIHAVGGLMVGSVFLLFVTIMVWDLLTQAESWNTGRLAALGFAGIVAFVTSSVSALPYVLGSLAARTAPRPRWSVLGWLLRDSPLWMPVGGSMAPASLGLGFWATRWARQR